MPKRLWGRRGGEPFMINPRLGILTGNPRRKRKSASRKRKNSGGATVARRSSARYMAWVRSFKKNPGRRRRKANVSHRRRRSRRNPYPMAGVALNPRRRRRSHRRRNPVMNARRHRRRRNPVGERTTRLLGINLPPIQAVLWTGLGFIAPQPIEAWLNTNIVPASLSTNMLGKYAVKIASVLGLSWIVKQVMGPSEARAVGIGGGAYVLISAVREFAPGMLPGVSAYVPYAGPGLSAYVPGTRQLAAGGVPVFGAASSNVVSNRFKRF
jgi:hypothetical protein